MGLERINFEQFLLSEAVVVGCGGMVVLKELNLNSFLLSEGVVVGCGGVVVLKGLNLNQFLLWEGLVVMKELILNTFYFQRVRWS